MATYYLDVTKTLEFGLNTGIQRVVRRITLGAASSVASRGVAVVPVVAVDGDFHSLTDAGLAALRHPTPRSNASLQNRATSLMRTQMRRLMRLLPMVESRWQQRQTNRRFQREHSQLYDAASVAPGPNDVLVLIDLVFGGSPAVVAAQRWHRRGTTVVAVIYDLIAVSHPQFVLPLVRHSFRRSLAMVTRMSTAVLTISRFCVAELERYLFEEGRVQPVAHFPLGADLDDQTIDFATRAEDTEIWEGNHPVYLMVGSIEPRKGHALVLDAFDRLWAANDDAKLIVIGNPGWDVDDLLTRLADHPRLNHQLFVRHGADDAEVANAMHRSTATIMASAVEGFGLPLVESLALGCPVIAADIPVFREIAGHHVAWFDRTDVDDLVGVVRAFPANRARFLALAERFDRTTWAEAAEGFLDALAAVLVASQQR